MVRPKTEKRQVRLIFAGSINDLDEDQVYKNSFFRMTPAQRLKEAWKMAEYAWKLKGKSADELRFDRTTAIIKKA